MRGMQITKTHATLVAALLAVAAVLGTVALTHTTGLGAASRRASDAAVAAKERQLAAYEQQLSIALAAATKPLPKAGASPAAPQQQRVVYHRPPPVVVVTHTHRGDDGHEAEGGGDD